MEVLPVEAGLADLRTFELQEDFDAVVNVLVEGTTFLDMFDPNGHCLFSRTEMESRFAGWNILHSRFDDFDAPGGRKKSFAATTAQKPRAHPED